MGYPYPNFAYVLFWALWMFLNVMFKEQSRPAKPYCEKSKARNIPRTTCWGCRPYTYIHIHIHPHTCTNTYLHKHAETHTYTSTYMHKHIHTHSYMYVYTCIYVHIIQVYVWVSCRYACMIASRRGWMYTCINTVSLYHCMFRCYP